MGDIDSGIYLGLQYQLVDLVSMLLYSLKEGLHQCRQSMSS